MTEPESEPSELTETPAKPIESKGPMNAPKGPMSKAGLTRRWKKEDRWEETSKFRTRVRAVLKEKGILKKEAADRAWVEAAEAFPPLSEEAEAFFASSTGSTRGTGAANKPASPPGSVTSRMLPENWGKLPESASFDVEVEWVHQNRVLVTEERSTGRTVLHWDRARNPAPSYGAVSLMQYASTNRKGFMDILQRTKPNSDNEDEGVARERRSVAEIRALLAQMIEVEK